MIIRCAVVNNTPNISTKITLLPVSQTISQNLAKPQQEKNRIVATMKIKIKYRTKASAVIINCLIVRMKLPP